MTRGGKFKAMRGGKKKILLITSTNNGRILLRVFQEDFNRRESFNLIYKKVTKRIRGMRN